MRETPGDPQANDNKVEAAPLTPELRALYERWEAAATLRERQEAWDRIVAYLREREVRVGSEAEARRQQVLREHARRQRRRWFF
ncbi:MAG: hypothetical protein IRZ14_20105 [Chloroflexi bacterium]|nr:hypothetical protein [Chloroflexota bacterium]